MKWSINKFILAILDNLQTVKIYINDEIYKNDKNTKMLIELQKIEYDVCQYIKNLVRNNSII